MLTAEMLVLFTLLGTVSSLDPSLTFHYVKHPRVFRRNELACQVCYGEFDCLSMERCGYNAAVSQLLEEDDGMKIVNDALKTKVDSMMYDLVMEDSLKEYNECIPLISSYTTCNKENICLGCKSCDCDDTGRWNCSETSICSNLPLIINHDILDSLIASLKNDNPSRHKRSFEGSEESSTRSMFDDLVQWIAVSQPTHVKISNDNAPAAVHAQTPPPIKNLTGEDNNNLAFDDILSNDNLEYFIKYSEQDITNDGKKHENNDSFQFLKILKDIEEGRENKVETDSSHGKINLLADLKQYLKEKSQVNEPLHEQQNSINAIYADVDDTGIDKQPSDLNSVTLVLKRNVRNVNETSIQNQTIASNVTPSFDNKTIKVPYTDKEIQHIIDVVTVLIGNERKEINHLTYVRDSLLKLMKKYHTNSNVTYDMNKPNSDAKSKKHGNWKFDMLNFYMNNLKRDVKDTLRDIYAIQKLKKLGMDSAAESISNIKPLLFALTSYYMKNFRDYQQTPHTQQYPDITQTLSTFATTTPITNISTDNQMYDSEQKPQRRAYQPKDINYYQIKLIKRALSRMLVMIDNDILSTNALSPLSAKAKNIFNRIIKRQYENDFANIHPSVRDPNFNLTSILTSLAEEWQNLPEVHELHPADRVYNMKLLHLTLSQGIDKLKDALIAVQFGYSRRMTFIEEYVGKNLISDIAKHLDTIDRRIINYAVANAIVADVFTPKRRDEQTVSVWHHIKGALSNSKNNMINYFKSKFKPKSYIVNDKVRKRAEEISKQKFLDVMKRWQSNFDAYHARNKRSVQPYRKRMKDIIPKYLRDIKGNPNSKGNQKNLIKLENKAPIHKVTTPTQSKRGVGFRQSPKNSTPAIKNLSRSSAPVKRNPSVKALSHHTEVQKNYPDLSEGHKQRGLPVYTTAQKGQPKRGVRSQQQHVQH